jgi:hypothetical protein
MTDRKMQHAVAQANRRRAAVLREVEFNDAALAEHDLRTVGEVQHGARGPLGDDRHPRAQRRRLGER